MASGYALQDQRLDELNRYFEDYEERPWNSEIDRLREMDYAEECLAVELERQQPGTCFWSLDREEQWQMLDDASSTRSYRQAVSNHLHKGAEK